MSDQTICMLSIDDRTLTTDLDRAGYRSMGVIVRKANNYDAAEKILLAEPIQIIVINLDFGNIDAFQITKHLKSHKEWGKIPIVITSVQTKARIRQRALDAGADLFVEQPLPRQYFIEKLKQLLEQQTRTTERVDIRGLVKFTFEGKECTCEMVDLSVSGILLSTDMDLPDGAVLQLSFELPTYKKPIKADGEVVRRVKTTRNKITNEQIVGGIGVKFVQIDKDCYSRLEKYIVKISDKNSRIIYYL